MICICGTKGSGKTAKLLKLSHDLDVPIAVKDAQARRNTMELARLVGLQVPEPLVVSRGFVGRHTYHCSIECNQTESGLTPVLIDDLQSFFIDMGISARAVTIDARSVNFVGVADCAPTLLDCLRFWWTARKEPRNGFVR